MSSASAARLHVIFDPAYYLIKRGARQKYFFDSKFLKFGNVFFRNDAEGLIANPAGLENDLSALSSDALGVRIYVFPK
jgi:hypothetical protein